MHQTPSPSVKDSATLERRSPAAPAHSDQMVLLRESGMTQPGIAEAMGVSLSTVNRAHMAYDGGGLQALKSKPSGGRQRENAKLSTAPHRRNLTRFATLPRQSGHAKSSFLVLPYDLAESFGGAQTRCSVVVHVGDARMGMVQKSAGEKRILTTADGGGGSPRCAKQMRTHLNAHSRKGAHADHTCHLFVRYRRAIVCGEPEG
jgi:hypothetical protein